jgi:phosphoglycerate dehydrogenase-like enzyme
LPTSSVNVLDGNQIVKPARLTVLVGAHRPDLGALEEADVRYATAAELPAAIEDAEALLVWDFAAEGLAEAWPHAKSLEWMHVGSAGVDKVLSPGVADSPVVVTNGKGVLDTAIAEYVLACVLAHAKDLPGTVRNQLEHRWEHRDTVRIAGRRALVAGCGSIGSAIARLLSAVGMTVDGVARSRRQPEGHFGKIFGAAELAATVPDYDFVILAVPLSASTLGMIGQEVLDAMNSHSLLINVGRGPVVDEEALVRTLRRGGIAGAALDVFCQEPLPPDNPLWDLPGVILSPHMAGDFVGWRKALQDVFEENFRRFTAGEELLNIVDKNHARVAST